MAEDLESPGAESQGGFLLLATLSLHERDETAGHEGECDERGGQDHPGKGEDDLDVVGLKPRSEIAAPAVEEDVDESADHRGDPEGEVDQGEEELASAE